MPGPSEGGRPRPSQPEVATCAQLSIAVESLRQLVDARLNSFAEIREEKFRSIETQLREREIRFLDRNQRTEETIENAKKSIDASLLAAETLLSRQSQAQAEAVEKSEKATAKQIDQIVALLTNANSRVDSQLDDLKQRLTIIEGRSMGYERMTHSTTTTWALVFSGLVAVAALVGLFINMARK